MQLPRFPGSQLGPAAVQAAGQPIWEPFRPTGGPSSATLRATIPTSRVINQPKVVIGILYLAPALPPLVFPLHVDCTRASTSSTSASLPGPQTPLLSDRDHREPHQQPCRPTSSTRLLRRKTPMSTTRSLPRHTRPRAAPPRTRSACLAARAAARTTSPMTSRYEHRTCCCDSLACPQVLCSVTDHHRSLAAPSPKRPSRSATSSSARSTPS